MPKATFNPEPEKYPLTTCPDGYVTLRRMPYGKWLKRQEMMLQMRMSGKGDQATAEMQMVNRLVTEFEFRECIIEHNLEDDNGDLLDFGKSTTLDRLDPRIGNEIGQYIMQLHEFEASLPN